MQQAEKKDLTKKKEAQVPTTIDLEETAGQGLENITARDVKLPILKILYANSKVLDESDGKYNEKAKQGDIYSETSQTLWKGKEGILVVPCLYVNTFNEWKDRGDSPGRPVTWTKLQGVMITKIGFQMEIMLKTLVTILCLYLIKTINL